MTLHSFPKKDRKPCPQTPTPTDIQLNPTPCNLLNVSTSYKEKIPVLVWLNLEHACIPSPWLLLPWMQIMLFLCLPSPISPSKNSSLKWKNKPIITQAMTPWPSNFPDKEVMSAYANEYSLLVISPGYWVKWKGQERWRKEADRACQAENSKPSPSRQAEQTRCWVICLPWQSLNPLSLSSIFSGERI